ncbi:MAG: hypothetical protein WKF97_12105 [Chitinophagaceae bacterium]
MTLYLLNNAGDLYFFDKSRIPLYADYVDQVNITGSLVDMGKINMTIKSQHLQKLVEVVPGKPSVYMYGSRSPGSKRTYLQDIQYF